MVGQCPFKQKEPPDPPPSHYLFDLLATPKVQKNQSLANAVREKQHTGVILAMQENCFKRSISMCLKSHEIFQTNLKWREVFQVHHNSPSAVELMINLLPAATVTSILPH